MAVSTNSGVKPNLTDKNLSDYQQITQDLFGTVDQYTNKLRDMDVNLGKVFQNIATNSTEINNSLKRTIDLTTGIGDSYKNYGKLVQNLSKIDIENRKIKAAKEAFIINLTSQGLKIEKEILNTALESLSANEKKLSTTKIQISEQEELQRLAKGNATIQATSGAKLKELKEEDEKLTREREALESKLLEMLGGQNSSYAEQNLIKLQLIDAEIIAADKAKILTKEIIKQNGFYGQFYDIYEKISKITPLAGLASAFSLASVVKTLTDYVFKIDKYSTDIANSSGVTKDFAQKVSIYYADSSSTLSVTNAYLDKSLLNLKAQAEAQDQLQKSTGQMALYTEDSVQSQIYLTKQLGLQGDEAARIAQLGLLNKTSTQDVTDNVADQVANFNKSSGLNLSIRDVLKDVAKVSGVIAANYDNNPKAIARAVAQAKSLGVSLQEASAASRSLLDFESSIENELEAELLTGKAFNLEKARALALSGDSAGALEEELKNVGSLAEFQRQNVVAKEAEAKAIGMTVDQLSDALHQQEVLKGSTIETKKAYEEILKSIKGSSEETKYRAELNSAMNGADLQAKTSLVSKQLEFEESMERVKDTFSGIVSGPLGKMVGAFVDVLNTTGGITAALTLGAAYMGFTAARAIATAFATEATAAAIGNWAGAAAGAVALTYAVTQLNSTPPPINVHDALIGPTGGIMIQTAEGQLVKPSPRDSVLVAPNAADAIGGGSSNSQSNSRMESLLAGILNVVSRPGGVYLDSSKVGTSMGLSYSVYA